MRKHNGMRPQDVLVLIKIHLMGDQPWRYGDIAGMLSMSQSEVAEALHRSMQARLVDDTKRKVFRASLFEFLVHGLTYVFPAQPGALVRGMATAHAAPPLADYFGEETDMFVWPDESGTDRGQAISPLTENVLAACKKDPEFYAYMALLDTLRIGQAREREAAIKELQQRLLPVGYAV